MKILIPEEPASYPPSFKMTGRSTQIGKNEIVKYSSKLKTITKLKEAKSLSASKEPFCPCQDFNYNLVLKKKPATLYKTW